MEKGVVFGGFDCFLNMSIITSHFINDYHLRICQFIALMRF